jgi:ribosomal protein S18 acetylase RimI-like enzyme
MHPIVTIRQFREEDRKSVNAVALSAWGEYARVFNNWDTMAHSIGNVASLARDLELFVAECVSNVVGVVGYVAPFGKREEVLPPEWAIVRMLSVSPEHRGLGIGRALTRECVSRAKRDNAIAVGLHTSPVMQIALPIYARMGFILERNISNRNGVPYALYPMRGKPRPSARGQERGLHSNPFCCPL